MNRPKQARPVHRTPGRIVVIALVCLYAGPVCALAGAILEAIHANGDPLFALAGVFWAIWLPLLLLAIVVSLVGPAPPEDPEAR